MHGCTLLPQYMFMNENKTTVVITVVV